MKTMKHLNIYKLAQRLADVTKSFVRSGNIPRARQCMLVAENLFKIGNKEIQSAIAKVYVSSLSRFAKIRHFKIRGLYPESLQKESDKQIDASDSTARIQKKSVISERLRSHPRRTHLYDRYFLYPMARRGM